MNSEMITDFKIGDRLDKVVVEAFPEYSRSQFSRLIETGDVIVNDEFKKAGYKLSLGDKISVNLESLHREPGEIDLQIVYEDKNVAVINKPTGVLVHSKGNFNDEPTVASWLKQRSGNNDLFWQNNRSGIVHRLDRATSGVMICAKNTETQKFLQKQFSSRKVKKTYFAIVQGHLKEPEAIIKLPIERNPKKPQSFRVGASGKAAETTYKVIAELGNHDLVELRPKTGRTHQLRVHLSYLGHVILGDNLYGPDEPGDMFLMAKSLEITLPGGQRKVFEVEISPIFRQKIKQLS